MPGCDIDEGRQQPVLDRVGGGGALGMPEHPHRPAPLALDPLDQPVRRPGDRPEAVPQAVQGLVVVGQHLTVDPADRREPLLALTEAGQNLLQGLTILHRNQILAVGPTFVQALGAILSSYQDD